MLFFKIGLGILFDDVLDRKESFLDYENKFIQKFEISSKFIFL